MRKLYPIILTTAGSDYIVYVPDLDIHTEGRSFSDAIFMAEDAISLVAITIQDDGLPVPEPSANPVTCAPGEILAYAAVDFEAYRREHADGFTQGENAQEGLNPET